MLLFRSGSFCFAQDALSFNDTLREVLSYLTGRIPANSTVVVLNFQSDYPNLSEYIIDDITSSLVNTDLFTVVDRRNLELLQQELTFQLSGEVSDETALSIGQRVGAQMVVSGAIAYLGEFYRLRVQAIEVESARIVGSRAFTVQPGRLLATLTGKPWTGPETPDAIPEPEPAQPDTIKAAPPAAKKRPAPAPSVTRLFYLGLRGGFSTRSYQASTNLFGTGASAQDTSVDLAAQASVQVFKILAFQAEAFVSYLPGDYFHLNDWPFAELRSPSMMLPLLAKLTFRPGSFLLAGFGGVYFTLPFGAMTLNLNGQDYSYNYTAPMGFIAGGNIGIKLGPGTLFADVRYAGDFDYVRIKGDWGSRDIYKRSMASYSLGYEFGLGGIKRK
jgi:TolB-like protein